MFKKQDLVEAINTYIQASMTGNEKLIKFAMVSLEAELDKLPESLNTDNGS